MKSITILLLTSTLILAEENQLFPLYTESGSIQQAAFNGGGAALPDKANGASLNPAALYGFHKLNGKRFGVVGSYQNKLDGKILAGSSVSIALDKQNVLAVDYLLKNQREDKSPLLHRGTLTYTSLVKEVEKDGLLSWGINLSYLNRTGAFNAKDSLPITVNSSMSLHPTGLDSIEGKHQSVMADIGAYQIDLKRGLSYGVVFENLFGYAWSEYDNSIITVHKDSLNTADSTYIAIDTTKYSGAKTTDSDWIDGKSKSLLVGFSANRKLAGDKIMIHIPFDVRFWGFMDKHLRQNSRWRDRCMMYTGAELNFGGALSLRGGYSWAPLTYYTDGQGNPQFKNTHQASGGFRISLKALSLEMAFKEREIGGGASLYF